MEKQELFCEDCAKVKFGFYSAVSNRDGTFKDKPKKTEYTCDICSKPKAIYNFIYEDSGDFKIKKGSYCNE